MLKDKNRIKKEIAKDLLALGSWVLYIIVILIALVNFYRPLLDQLIIAGVLIVILRFIFYSDAYVSRGFVLIVFISLFYKNLLISLILFVFFIGLVYSAYTLKRSRKSRINGFIIGILVCIVSYYLSNFTIRFITA